MGHSWVIAVVGIVLLQNAGPLVEQEFLETAFVRFLGVVERQYFGEWCSDEERFSAT
jgi:hypothetical protein